LIRIGVLASLDSEFAQAVVRNINHRMIDGIKAEFCKIFPLSLETKRRYDIILDRISHVVPFYQAYLKNAVLQGTYVINNPFWSAADDKFFNYTLAKKMNIPIPKTLLLPQKEYEYDFSEQDLTNICYPADLHTIVENIGFPAILKPYDGYGWRSVYKINNYDELMYYYNQSGSQVMMLQEFINYDHYVRAFVIGKKKVIAIRYNPEKKLYVVDHKHLTSELGDLINKYSIQLCEMLDYEINTVEFAISNNIPYAIDYMNPVPDGNPRSITPFYFREVVVSIADMIIEKAQNKEYLPPVSVQLPTRYNSIIAKNFVNNIS